MRLPCSVLRWQNHYSAPNPVVILIRGFAGEGETKIEIVPVAFGLSAVKIIFIMDEKLGTTEPLEEKITKISGVNSVEVTDVRRCIG